MERKLIMMGADRIILFGSGRAGDEALNFFGRENIAYFCDNNPDKVGTEISGKMVISFERLKQEYCDDIVIICILNDRIAYEIAQQCEENGILDYLYFNSVKKSYPEPESALAYIEKPINRMRIRREMFVSKINELQEQVNYFKNHADIKSMKPARGKLRERQLNSIHVSAEFFEIINGLNIKPFLYGGNLVGYVRHNGFIPWDDDIDFALIREEYEKLKDFCRQNLLTHKEFCNKSKETVGGKTVAPELEEYYFIEHPDFFTVYKCLPSNNDEYIRVDFFVLEYYADGYSFEELRKWASEVREKFFDLNSIEDRFECMKSARIANAQNIAKESEKVYFGIDNMEMSHKHHKGWIPGNIIFPLQKVLYEGEYFWVPNKPEEFATYEYKDIWEFPDDVGIPLHVQLAE